MTTYGTIPTSSSPEYTTRAKHHLVAWPEFFSLHSLSLPKTTTLLPRIKANLSYFQMNYTLVVLLIIFITLLWNPLSLIVYVVIMVAWVFLYFMRDEPLRVFSYTVGEGTVVVVLGVVTVGLLLVTAVWNVVGGVVVGVVLVLVHAAVRGKEDLEVDREAAVLPPSEE